MAFGWERILVPCLGLHGAYDAWKAAAWSPTASACVGVTERTNIIAVATARMMAKIRQGSMIGGSLVWSDIGRHSLSCGLQLNVTW